jgi:hypothetical protein
VTAASSTKATDPSRLTVHEWGTFTSIAGDDGSAVEWLPQTGPQDLPCFVERTRFDNIKGLLSGTVRMETPVLYFYAPEPTTVNVSVGFKQGLITEWYPRADVTPGTFNAAVLQRPWNGHITWKEVRILPRASASLLTEIGASHYYAARQTDAAPLQAASQHEKFLFYRGVGRFAPPIAATLAADGQIAIRSIDREPVGAIIVFENYGGSIRFNHARGTGTTLGARVPSAAGELTALRRRLERMLVAEGLYPREAAAMIETWRDSWFEEGTRLFYIASRKSVDETLPLVITPAPTAVDRVFVGRMELLTPRTLDNVRRAVLSGDVKTFGRYGRFLEPITRRIIASSADAERKTFEQHLQAAYHAYYGSMAPTNACR